MERKTPKYQLKGCGGCIYWRRLGWGATTCCCHYCLITSRARGCPPGKGCEKRKTGKERKA